MLDYLLGRNEGENLNWWEGKNPPAYIELDDSIRSQPNLRLFGDPMSEDVKGDIMSALRTVWEVLKKAARK